MTDRRLIAFADFVFDPVSLRLSRSGKPLTITHKALSLLRCLIDNRGTVVAKAELMNELWPDAIVEEGNLTQQISTLRKALGERPDERKFIATISGRGYAFVGAVTEHHGAGSEIATVPAKRSLIALAPLVSGTGTAESADVAARMSEALAVNLTRMHGFAAVAVKAPVGALSPVCARTLAQTAGAQYVLRGHLTCHSGRWAVAVQVVDGQTEAAIISESYEWNWADNHTDVMMPAATLAQRIAAGVRVFQAIPKDTRLASRAVETAHELYLRGKYHQHTGQPEGLLKALDYFQKVVAEVPKHAGAWLGISDCYNILITVGRLSFAEYGDEMLKAARSAMAIDESLPDCHVSLAAISEFHYDWRAAEYHYMRALSQDTANAQAHRWYGEYLIRMARFGEALHEVKAARDLDPLARSANAVLGLALSFCGRFEEAEEQFAYALEMDETYHRTRILLAMSRLRRGDYIGALASVEAASDPDAEVLGWTGCLQAMAGGREAAASTLARLRQQAEVMFVPAFSMAAIYIGLAEHDRAFEWLERAYEERAFQLGFLQVDVLFRPLRGDLRFNALLRKTHLSEISTADH